MAISAGGIVNGLTHTINKLRITQVQDNDSNTSSVSGSSSALSNFANNAIGDSKIFEVQINPDKYQKKYNVVYYEPPIIGRPEGTKNFDYVQGENLTVTFTLDGTGVIPASITDVGSALASVATSAVDFASRSVGLGGVSDTGYVTRRIKELKKVVYDFNPDHHEPPVVVITWGDVPPFRGKLDDLQVTYTLFSPDGAPLRAEVQLQFGEHGSVDVRSSTSNTAARVAGGIGARVGGALLSSPDLTHRRTVKATDTLPLLCENIYKDASFHWQVAQANNLTHFRTLETGTEVFFPPIER